MTPTIAPAGHSSAEVADYVRQGFWGTDALTDNVRRWAAQRPGGLAFADGERRVTWSAYDELSDHLAAVLVDAGLRERDALAVLLPDSADVHVAWLAAEKAGLVVVGIGSRAGEQEVQHLVRKSRANAVLTGPEFGGRPATDVVATLRSAGATVVHLSLGASGRTLIDDVRVDGTPVGPVRADNAAIERRRLGPSDLFMLNSTSGTTGLPKCVMHTQNRWVYFHQLAVKAAQLTPDDVFCSAIPSPFGFGLWTAHFTPTLLGAPVHLRRRFDAAELIRLIEAERVTVLAAVTTQFIMMLNSPALGDADLTSLRVMFTGGESVPFHRAAEFEDRTGAKVLQFYGSNETGALSCTTTTDDQQRRLTTAGRVIADMQVRLYEPSTREPLETGRGQPACRGPATCEGYYDDPDGNAALYTEDGWMLMGDIVEIDRDGYLRVVGRTSDIIIRGGKNISAAAVEAEVATHPSVAVAAAVAAPDSVFGERVCVYVEPRANRTVTLDDIVAHLAARGVTREWFPEHLVVVDEMPRSSGGKIAKAELRADLERRLSQPDDHTAQDATTVATRRENP